MQTKSHYEYAYKFNKEYFSKNKYKPSPWERKVGSDIMKLELNGLRVLDAGPEQGHLLKSLVKRGIKPFAVDVTPSIVKKLNSEGITAKQADLSADRIPFPSNYFDIIIFTEVIEHLFDCQHAVDELYRVLKKGGTLYITTHNTLNIFMRVKFLLGMIPAQMLDASDRVTRGGHIRVFNEKALRRILIQAGFRKEGLSNRGFFAMVLFEPPILKPLFAQHLYFAATK